MQLDGVGRSKDVGCKAALVGADLGHAAALRHEFDELEPRRAYAAVSDEVGRDFERGLAGRHRVSGEPENTPKPFGQSLADLERAPLYRAGGHSCVFFPWLFSGFQRRAFS